MVLAAIKKIPIGTILSTAAGVAGLGLVAYDAHSHGKVCSTMSQQNDKTDSLETSYLNKLSFDSPSIVQNKLRDKMFAWKADEEVTPFFSSLKGYLGGVSEMLFRDIIPLTLSVGAVASTIIAPKKFFSKAFGIGLAVYGVGFVLHDLMGLGKKR